MIIMPMQERNVSYVAVKVSETFEHNGNYYLKIDDDCCWNFNRGEQNYSFTDEDVRLVDLELREIVWGNIKG